MDVSNIERRLTERQAEVDAWLERQADSVCCPIYSSFDLRDGGFKVSAVDANVFPAGFNNLCDLFLDKGAELFRDYVATVYGGASRVVIYPESHTRNKHYLQNLFALQTMLNRAGLEVLIATADSRFVTPVTELETIEGQSIEIHRLTREGDLLRCEDFVPDIILVNNDFSDGRPDEIVNLAQPVTPPPQMGWYARSKWEHFQIFDSLMQEFSEILDVDPWLLSPYTEFEEDVHFKDGAGIDRVAARVDYVLDRVSSKYSEYGIGEKPLVFVKDHTGTYGMGIIVVESGEELLQLNRSQRNKMSRGKGSSEISGVLIQECIPTVDYYMNQPGEPVVYMIGSHVLGGFFRYSERKSETESLNSPGTRFASLCLTDVNDFDQVLACAKGHCSFSLYYTIARVSCIAMGHEMKNRDLCPSSVSGAK